MSDSTVETAGPEPVGHDAHLALLAFATATIAGLFAVVAYWANWGNAAIGLGVAAALFGIGFGLVFWTRSLGVNPAAVQARHSLRLTEAEEANLANIEAETERTFGRRPALLMALVGAIGSLVAAIFGPLMSLGPAPNGTLKRTGWKQGSRVVTDDGKPIRAGEGELDQLVTAFPDGQVGRDDSQIVLMKIAPELMGQKTLDGGAVDGWVAFSKICPHAGCSVGLYGVDPRKPDVVRKLVCPCHQSVFDPLDGAEPVGGPAPRPLPQLPLAVDADGYLIATADFSEPVGPIAWHEG